RCLLIEEPNIQRALGPAATGLVLWREDAIIVGRIRRCPGSRHPVRIGDVWLVVTQEWFDQGVVVSRGLWLTAFSEDRDPALPWEGAGTERYGSPVVSLQP